MIPLVGSGGLAAFADVWCDDGYYTAAESERILARARDAGMAPKIHADAYSYIGGSDLAAKMGMASVDHLNYTPRTRDAPSRGGRCGGGRDASLGLRGQASSPVRCRAP